MSARAHVQSAPFGEEYLIVNNVARAEDHLATQICLIPCEEFEELKETIEAHNRSGNR